ncbi:MAG: 50S ribosomal protein L28 [Brevinema sp.]
MSRVCELSGKKVMYGNKVSHSHRKTRTHWAPNLQKKTFVMNDGSKVELRVCAKIIKTIDRFGVDAVLKKFVKKGIIIAK